MKKILSIILTVTMIFSLVAAFRTPTAKAAPLLTITDTTKALSYYQLAPNYPPVITNTYTYTAFATKPNVYSMGALVHVKVEGFTAGDVLHAEIYNILAAPTGSFLEFVFSGTSMTIGVPTANVVNDGPYYIKVFKAGEPATFDDTPIFYIQYNVTEATVNVPICLGDQAVLTGYVTRAMGYPLTSEAYVWVYDVTGTKVVTVYKINPATNPSGQYYLTWVVANIGLYRLVVSDNYPVAAVNDYDGMVYKTYSNVPTTTITLSTYITPFLYKGVDDQPILLVLKDQDGNYVTGATIIVTAGGVINDAFDEISKGFYRATIDVNSGAVDVRFKASWTPPWGGDPITDTLIVNTRDLGVYNPYIDITAPDAIPDYGKGPWEVPLDSVESVYDKLPCTIGNSFEIKVDAYTPADPDNWYINPDLSSWDITGPIEIIDDFDGAFGDNIKVLVTGDGKISVSMSFVAWERANKSCPDWYNTPEISDIYTTDVDVMKYNACCHTFEKTVDICEVASCTYGGVTLTGANITDSTTVEVGKKVDKFSISIDPTGAPADLVCSCPNYIVAMYMVDKKGVIIDDAFTVDTWSGTPATGGMIWYNPVNATGPDLGPLPDKDLGVLKDQPVQTFLPTGIYSDYDVDALESNGLKFGDCPFNLYGITFNYPTDTECEYTLVVKVFGLERIFDACGGMDLIYPMIAEDFDPITVTPSITKLTATGTIWEGAMDPDKILAGIGTVIDITDPKFTFDETLTWKFYLNGKKISGPSSSETDTGYRFSNICLNKAGTFKIYGYMYSDDCTEMEEVTLEFTVVVPEFTVEIGLMDGTKIPNDGILTEGFAEEVYVTVTDPRGLHDFTNDDWDLSVGVEDNDCGLPPAVVCGSDVAGVCCGREALAVTGYDNPCLEDDPVVDLYFVSPCGADIIIDSFKLVPPTIKVDPAEVPFTIPTTATHVTFTVTDAHGHGAPGAVVTISGTLTDFGAGASGYSWTASTATTGKKGEIDWAFVPPFSGKYKITAVVTSTCVKPCGWLGINTSATLEAVYRAPVVDTVKPVVEASAPANVTSPMVTVAGKVTDNVGVVSLWIGAMKVDFAPDGTFSAKVEVAEGANTIKVVAFDAAGLMGEKTLTVTYAVPKVTVVKIQIGSDIMTVNGKAVQIDAPAEIKNGRTFLPLRAISEALGATVDWIAETQGITVTLGENTIGLQVGNTSAVVNGTVMTLDAAPYIKNNRTMVPFRVIAEGLGATVEWDPALRIVTVTLAQ